MIELKRKVMNSYSSTTIKLLKVVSENYAGEESRAWVYDSVHKHICELVQQRKFTPLAEELFGTAALITTTKVINEIIDIYIKDGVPENTAESESIEEFTTLDAYLYGIIPLD